MSTSHASRLGVGLIAAAVLLTACAPSPVPSTQMPEAPARKSPARITQRGLYVDLQTGVSSSQILGYRDKNGRPRPFCQLQGASFADRIATDPAGDVMLPDSFTSSITVIGGPRMCGKQLGSFTDPYGQPLDAASDDAATGNIAVANVFDNSGNGSISVCTLANGCTTNLTNKNMVQVAGVAMANNGDCWASAVTSSFVSTLTYFQHCAGSGQQSGGYQNKAYGGLELDSKGNILSISWSGTGSQLYVYQGCRPQCTLIGGPFTLKHATMTGHLDGDGKLFAAADYQRARVDVYGYTPTSLTYQYSLTDGLSAGAAAGVAFTPRSKE
ncbi:MAG: hypothetical protein JO190_02005 [Candidatus Eremiobacteraeota bacterium]|nr:hypothetical protein [Candidatus Eremiobacteraeota bacterium]